MKPFCQCETKSKEHEEGMCENEKVALYNRYGVKKWLCRDCTLPGDVEVEDSK